MSRWIRAFAFCLICAPCVWAQTYIVKDGRPQAQIVLSDRPPRTTRLAAEELQTYIAAMTGAQLPITTAPANDPAVRIYVGRSAGTDRLKISDEGLKYGAFRMLSGPDYLVLLGHDSAFAPVEPWNRNAGDADLKRLLGEWDALTGQKWGYPYGNLYKQYSERLKVWDNDERGSLNAVYEFLRMQGVRWYLPDPLGEIVPKKASIELTPIDRTVRPAFALRYPYQYGREFAHEAATREEALWRLRMGEWRAPEVIGLGQMGHGINDVHSRDEVKAAHPEYYALFGGKRDTEQFGEGRPCLSSEGLFQQNVKYVRALYDIMGAPMVSVMPQDGYANLCQCDLCKGKDTPQRGWNGQLSDYVWDYVNRVATEVYKTHPDRKVICFAYAAYLLPPATITKLSPNVVVGICQHRRLFYEPEERRKFEDLRKAWLDKMPEGHQQIIIYDYYLHTAPRNCPCVPIFFPHAIAQDLRALKGISLGDFVEVYRDKQDIRTLAIDHLNLYVTSRLWWDPDQDVDALLEEYYTDFYGPAREEMKAFIEYCEANFIGMEKSADKIGKVFELLSKAREKAPADSVYGRRIAFIAAYVQPLQGLREQLAKGRGNVPEAVAFERPRADIRMDGRLDDKFWEKLRVYSLSELQTGKALASQTSFRVGWAEDAIYLGIRCDDRDTKTLNIGATKNEDSNIWNGDCVEILLETQTHSYYQIAINPAGAMMDLDRKKGLDTLWSSGAEAASYIGPGYWSIEIRIPVAGPQQEELDALHAVSGARPIENYPWYFNVCRQRIRENDKEVSAFSPTGTASFHEPMKFGKLYVR